MRDVQEWRREALLSLLKNRPNQTASALSDLFEAMCDSENVPKKYSGSMGSQTVSGILRQMTHQGLVVAADSARNARAGRDEPRWSLVDPASAPTEFPPILDMELSPPEQEPAQAATGVDPVEHAAFRTTLDELAGITARHRDELAGLLQRHAREMGTCLDRISNRMEPYRGG